MPPVEMCKIICIAKFVWFACKTNDFLFRYFAVLVKEKDYRLRTALFWMKNVTNFWYKYRDDLCSRYQFTLCWQWKRTEIKSKWTKLWVKLTRHPNPKWYSLLRIVCLNRNGKFIELLAKRQENKSEFSLEWLLQFEQIAWEN